MLALLSRAGMIGLGIWHGDPGNDAEVMFAEGKALANRLGNVRAQALLEAAYSGALGSAGDVEAALEHSLEGARLAELSRRREREARAGARRSSTRTRSPVISASRFRLSEEALGQSAKRLKLGASSLGFSPYIFLVHFRARCSPPRPLG